MDMTLARQLVKDAVPAGINMFNKTPAVQPPGPVGPSMHPPAAPTNQSSQPARQPFHVTRDQNYGAEMPLATQQQRGLQDAGVWGRYRTAAGAPLQAANAGVQAAQQAHADAVAGNKGFWGDYTESNKPKVDAAQKALETAQQQHATAQQQHDTRLDRIDKLQGESGVYMNGRKLMGAGIGQDRQLPDNRYAKPIGANGENLATVDPTEYMRSALQGQAMAEQARGSLAYTPQAPTAPAAPTPAAVPAAPAPQVASTANDMGTGAGGMSWDSSAGGYSSLPGPGEPGELRGRRGDRDLLAKSFAASGYMRGFIDECTARGLDRHELDLAIKVAVQLEQGGPGQPGNDKGGKATAWYAGHLNKLKLKAQEQAQPNPGALVKTVGDQYNKSHQMA